jgi:2,4-dienoyl-CoA reductase-like NADH-dependent reductase (Old Yellow Enzyme family)/thioredoxin reductase
LQDKENSTMKKKEEFPHLFSPIRIGNIRLKNRIIAAPTSPSMISTDGHFTPALIAYLEEKARGGAAVVTYGEGIVHSATGKSHNKQLQLDSFGVKQGLVEATRAIHNAGALANIQLSHGGKYGGLVSVGGDEDKCTTAYGPSHEITPAGEVYEMPQSMIYEIVDSYRNAAKLCKDCGFDMVQVHAAHGWLFSQFLSPIMNRRTDDFGGTLENRIRFLLLALDAVRQGVGPGFPVEIRLSGDDLSDEGLHQEDCIQVAEMVDDKIDLFNISCGNHEDPALFCRTHPSAFYPRGVNVYLAAGIKKHVTKPVACVGALNDPVQMDEIIAKGDADIVELGRALLADPCLPQKAHSGNEKDITPCIRCFECFGETTKTESVKCTVNPVLGQEIAKRYPEIRPSRRKNVLIAGGGPAGMEAAVIAAERGHIVTLVEKNNVLGGNLLPGGMPYFKRDISDFCKLLIQRVKNASVTVKLNTEVTSQYISAFSPDVLIAAIGADEIRPPVPGIMLPNVIMATDAELHPEKVGDRVVLLGGGLVGSEAAVSFAHDGKKCSIIEMKDAVAAETNPFYRGGLLPEIEKAADIYVKTKVKEIRENGVVCENKDGEFTLAADSVVCAAGFRAPYATVDAFCNLVDEYYIIGDCNKVGQIYTAINNAYYAALRI